MNTMNEFYNQILNKKFSKKNEGGYDPLDVDKFLDEILYKLKNLDENFQKIYLENNELVKKNKELKNLVESKITENQFLETRVSELMKSGYHAHRIQTELSELRKKIDEKK